MIVVLDPGEHISMEALEGNFDLWILTCDLWHATYDFWLPTYYLVCHPSLEPSQRNNLTRDAISLILWKTMGTIWLVTYDFWLFTCDFRHHFRHKTCGFGLFVVLTWSNGGWRHFAQGYYSSCAEIILPRVKTQVTQISICFSRKRIICLSKD